MRYGDVSAKARTGARIVVRTLAIAAATAMLALAPTGTMAQPQPKAKAAPKAQPAPAAQQAPAPAMPQGQPQPGQQPQPQQSAEPLQLIYGPWVKFCGNDPSDKKRVCATVKDGRDESGSLVVAIQVFEKDGEQHKLLRLTMPYGVALMIGTRMIVDQDQPVQAPFWTCPPPSAQQGGCWSDYEATPELLGKLKKGQYLTLQAIFGNNAPITSQMELKDFAKVYDGPPTDPKVFAESQAKLRDEMQKRADDARKKMEAQNPPGAAAPPAGAAPPR